MENSRSLLSIHDFMPPPWTTWVTFVQPLVLTRSQGRLCLVIQREFIESLILDLGAEFRVPVIFALPRRDTQTFIRPLWRILQYDWIILQVGVPRTEEEWNYIVYWGRTTLPHGLFQEDDRVTWIRVFSQP